MIMSSEIRKLAKDHNLQARLRNCLWTFLKDGEVFKTKSGNPVCDLDDMDALDFLYSLDSKSEMHESENGTIWFS